MYALVRIELNDCVEYVKLSNDIDKLYDMMKKEYSKEYVDVQEWADEEQLAFGSNISQFCAHVGDNDEVYTYWQIIEVEKVK